MSIGEVGKVLRLKECNEDTMNGDKIFNLGGNLI